MSLKTKDAGVWLVCGGRDFADEARAFGILDGLILARGRPTYIVEGGARGADEIARRYAEARQLRNFTMNAEWHRYGRAAGSIRNNDMLVHHRPALVIAFPGGRGTADMVTRARSAKVELYEVKE